MVERSPEEAGVRCSIHRSGTKLELLRVKYIGFTFPCQGKKRGSTPLTRSYMQLLQVKPFRQAPGYCGPAALKMVLEYFGIHKSERELARLTGATREKGVEASGLVQAARILGCNTRIKNNATFADIRVYLKRKIPIIVDWFSVDDGHYSVVVGMNQRKIYLQDPEIARVRAMNLLTFKRLWFDFPHNHLRSKRDLIIRRLIAIYR